jgi:hypothetical protein
MDGCLERLKRILLPVYFGPISWLPQNDFVRIAAFFRNRWPTKRIRQPAEGGLIFWRVSSGMSLLKRGQGGEAITPARPVSGPAYHHDASPSARCRFERMGGAGCEVTRQKALFTARCNLKLGVIGL